LIEEHSIVEIALFVSPIDRYEAALENKNVRAMLDAIAKAEGTDRIGHKGGYDVLMGGGTFQDMSRHPNVSKRFFGGNSTAAGRYQFLTTTWRGVAGRCGLRDFSPHSQNIAAIAKIDERGALEDVMRGDIRTATRKLNREWASLPGSPYGQRTLSISTFLKGFVDALSGIGRGLARVGGALWNGLAHGLDGLGASKGVAGDNWAVRDGHAKYSGSAHIAAYDAHSMPRQRYLAYADTLSSSRMRSSWQHGGDPGNSSTSISRDGGRPDVVASSREGGFSSEAYSARVTNWRIFAVPPMPAQ
jgi:muramidase (phage lysozyme)